MGQRPCLPLQWLADQKEALTSLYEFLKDTTLLHIHWYTGKPFTDKKAEKTGSATIIRNRKDISCGE